MAVAVAVAVAMTDGSTTASGRRSRISATVSQIMSSACRCHAVHLPSVEATLLRPLPM